MNFCTVHLTGMAGSFALCPLLVAKGRRSVSALSAPHGAQDCRIEMSRGAARARRGVTVGAAELGVMQIINSSSVRDGGWPRGDICHGWGPGRPYKGQTACTNYFSSVSRRLFGELLIGFSVWELITPFFLPNIVTISDINCSFLSCTHATPPYLTQIKPH